MQLEVRGKKGQRNGDVKKKWKSGKTEKRKDK